MSPPKSERREFFQAAEDLHLKGRVMDLTFRRTHLSHSLFTTPLGRNWDFLGNMRLVELPNGEVHLMDGEAGVERYGPTTSGVQPRIEQLEHLARGNTEDDPGFNYAQLWGESQYESPAGVYRRLIKAAPVAMDGMPRPESDEAAPAVFYLAGKHGTVWTFAEDVRYRGFGTLGGDATGVHAQYLLVSIHELIGI